MMRTSWVLAVGVLFLGGCAAPPTGSSGTGAPSSTPQASGLLPSAPSTSSRPALPSPGPSASSMSVIPPPTPGGTYAMGQPAEPIPPEHTSASITLATGTYLHIAQTQTACCYSEGQVSYLVLRDASGRVVAWRGYQADAMTTVALDAEVAPGNYRIESFQRPCDGNCGYLDPPTGVCATSVVLAAGVRYAATVLFTPGGGCHFEQAR